MKKLFLILCTMALLVACGEKNSSGGSSQDANVTDTPTATTTSINQLLNSRGATSVLTDVNYRAFQLKLIGDGRFELRRIKGQNSGTLIRDYWSLLDSGRRIELRTIGQGTVGRANTRLQNSCLRISDASLSERILVEFEKAGYHRFQRLNLKFCLN